MPNALYSAVGKRAFDLAVAVTLTTLLAPVMLLVALAVRVKLGAPVVFRQQRPGRDERPFVLYKFRSMLPLRAGMHAAAAEDADRLTRFGRWLRSTSLDELPELLNVIRGDMSLVGPRPLLMEYLPLYSTRQRRRHAVRPGITGWAQINGRNSLTWPARLELDVWYVDHLSLSLDLRILGRTLGQVLHRRGISQPGHATAERFSGNQPAGTSGLASEQRGT